jgi:hypothetical protein
MTEFNFFVRKNKIICIVLVNAIMWLKLLEPQNISPKNLYLSFTVSQFLFFFFLNNLSSKFIKQNDVFIFSFC